MNSLLFFEAIILF